MPKYKALKRIFAGNPPRIYERGEIVELKVPATSIFTSRSRRPYGTEEIRYSRLLSPAD